MSPTTPPDLILVPDGLIPDEHGAYVLHPALRFIAPRLGRSAKLWATAPLMTPIEWYAVLIGVAGGPACLLAAAMGDAVPADVRQGWLFSPFAGRLGRDAVHIMPDEVFAWDADDALWLAGLLQSLLTGDGFTLLIRDACLLAVSPSAWDARPASLARLSGHTLPDRHPAGADGGRLMRLCAEMQMLLAANPSPRRRAAGLPDVMGVWPWAPAVLPAMPVARPAVVSDDRLIRACMDDGAGSLPVAILGAAQIEAQIEGQEERRRLPRHFLLGGDHHAVLLDTRGLPRFGRAPWRVRRPVAFDELTGRLGRLSGVGEAG